MLCCANYPPLVVMYIVGCQLYDVPVWDMVQANKWNNWLRVRSGTAAVCLFLCWAVLALPYLRFPTLDDGQWACRHLAVFLARTTQRGQISRRIKFAKRKQQTWRANTKIHANVVMRNSLDGRISILAQSATAVERIKTWTEQVFFISIASIQRPHDCRCCQWRRRAHNAMRFFVLFSFLLELQPISMAWALAVEAKVIGNSVHFKLFFALCLRLDCVSSLVCQFNFGHDPFSHDDFTFGNFGESNLCRCRMCSKSNTIAAIMCPISMATQEELLLMPLLPVDFSVDAHTHSHSLIWMIANIWARVVGSEYRNSSNYNDECVFILVHTHNAHNNDM